MFPSWLDVRYRYREVVKFVVGLMKDSRPLVQHVYEMQVEDYLNKMRNSDDIPTIDPDLFKLLHAESRVPLFDHPLHNKYINYYDHEWGEPDTTPIYCPSRIYRFWDMRHEVELENHLEEGEEIPPCAMFIGVIHEALSDSLLLTCSEISKHQVVTDLRLWQVTCNNHTLQMLRLTNIKSLFLLECDLPDSHIRNFLHQLFGCGESLQGLELRYMNLAPFESLLDELLEDLVAHHQRKRKAVLAQRKLLLSLMGSRLSPTNLCEEFVEKWRNRCEKVDSIDCEIY